MARTSMGAALSRLRQFIHARAAQDGPDDELLRRLARGHDPVAFEAIVRRYGGLVLGVCHRQLRDTNDVEDAFQATFLVLLRKAGSIRGGRLPAWLYGTALRVARHVRAVRNRQPAGPLEEVAVEMQPSCVDRAEVRQAIEEEIERLPERYRQPVLLCQLGGQTQEQAARLLGLPLGTIATRVRRGLERLRDRLARRGISPTTALAPVQVAPALVEATVRAASAPAETAASRLAADVLRAWLVQRLVRGAACLACLLVAGATLAAAVLGPRRPADPEPPGAVAQPAPASRWVERGRFRLERAAGEVAALAVAPDSASVAVSGAFTAEVADIQFVTTGVQMWEVSGKRMRRALYRTHGVSAAVRGLAFVPGALVTAESGLYRWNVDNGTWRHLVDDWQILGVVASRDGRVLAAPTAGGQVHLYEAQTGRLLSRLAVAPLCLAVAFPPGGDTLVTADGGGLRTWAMGSGRQRLRLPLELADAWPLALSPCGRHVAHGQVGQQRLHLSTVPGPAREKVPALAAAPTALVFSPAGDRLAIGCLDGSVRLWDRPTGRELAVPRGLGAQVTALAFGPDGKTLTAGDRGGNVVVWVEQP